MLTAYEIHHRLNVAYIERLSLRLKKMRKQLMNRDWIGMKSEALHLAEGAQNFGYQELAHQVQPALKILNGKKLSQTTLNAEAKQALEELFRQLDHFLEQSTPH